MISPLYTYNVCRSVGGAFGGPHSPLLFRLHEAIGEPLPTGALPRAYAVADLRDLAGWKPQLEAAERLAVAREVAMVSGASSVGGAAAGGEATGGNGEGGVVRIGLTRGVALFSPFGGP